MQCWFLNSPRLQISDMRNLGLSKFYYPSEFGIHFCAFEQFIWPANLAPEKSSLVTKYNATT